MLGPSGCGKTTTLRMIGGFEDPTAGRVFLGGSDVTERPPYKRDVNTVFQSYALFPHLNVEKNVGFGLERKKVGKDELRKRVGDVLELVQLAPLAKRKPAQLSGGQAQRVALARALVADPALVLLDEPFASLDAITRLRMHDLVHGLRQQHNATMLLVTHDVDEAIALADRILVMRDGRIGSHHRVELTAEERVRGSEREQLRGRLLTEIGVSLPTQRRKSA
jgi:spermidine/putrescine transport system ATP-binding protein